MKNLINDQIEQELMREKPNRSFVATLRVLSHPKTKITFAAFTNTARFLSRDFFADECPNYPLHHGCLDVIRYAGGFIIQVLKTNEFYIQFEDGGCYFNFIAQAEHGLWDREISKII